MNALLWGPGAQASWEVMHLLIHCALLSLVAIGGAIATAPDLQRYMVEERHWITAQDFSSGLALAQAAPGPNLVFVVVIGFKALGLAGALAALLGSLLPSSLISLRVAAFKAARADQPLVQAFTQGAAPITVGLLLSTAWILAEPAHDVLWGWVLLAVSVAWMMGTQRNPLWVLALGAAVGALGWI